MKTNIAKIQSLYDVQSHTAEKVNQLFQEHLPFGYAKKIVETAAESKRIVSASFVRQVKTFVTEDLEILNWLIELAQENEADAAAKKEKFKKLIS